MTAFEVFHQQDGGTTKAYYAELAKRGPVGEIAVALFRAQKRSSRAKDYSRGKYRRAAYDVKEWSLSEVCRLLAAHGESLGFRYGWKEDPDVRFGESASYVLYVDLPGGPLPAECDYCGGTGEVPESSDRYMKCPKCARDQVSFHSPSRGAAGPDYPGAWDQKHLSEARIIAFCEIVMLRDPGGAVPVPLLDTWPNPAPLETFPAPAPAERPRFGDPAHIAASRRVAKSYQGVRRR